ncbi:MULTISPECIES: AAA family ATPase [unclassified Chryseobacterium]|uniref:AAA family ATPase n=1 Tax=unclassified Chryseobacterium TaxID=2593645 RepID=UPI00301AC35C
MVIHVQKFGAIKTAEIDLSKKLSVFCGPNGTGKTYLAYLIYALTSHNNRSIRNSLEKKYLRDLLENNETTINIDKELLIEYKNQIFISVKESLWNIFALSENKSEKYFKDTQITSITTDKEFIENIKKIEINEPVKIFGFDFSIFKSEDSFDVKISISEKLIKNNDFISFIEILLLSSIYSILSFYPVTSSTIFPVERNSIYTFSDELSINNNERFELIKELSAGKKDINPIELLLKRSTRYPQPIRDGLRVAEDLENIKKKDSIFYDFALEIEKELLKGKVDITNEGNVEFASEKAPKIKLSFHQSSSIVKTLSSLVIYLKHLASYNDLLIIDEPELNLHPDNQVKLTRIFARLINKGLRLVISTHSDYIIREINNLIMFSSLKDKKKFSDLYDVEKGEFIRLDDIGAYFFNFKNDKAKQTEVIPIKIDRNGFEVKTLDKTIEDLNEISNSLYFNLKYNQ